MSPISCISPGPYGDSRLNRRSTFDSFTAKRHFALWAASRFNGGEDTLTAPKILLREDKAPPSYAGSADLAWALIAGVGFVLLATNFFDLLGFAAIPRAVGLQQWEQSAVARAYETLPLITLGLVLPLSAGIASGRRRLVLVMVCVLIPFGTLLLITPLLYISGLVTAWYAGEDPVERFSLKDGIINRAAWRATIYPLLYLWLGLKGVYWAHTPQHVLGPPPT
jgi:hypothetical protein